MSNIYSIRFREDLATRLQAEKWERERNNKTYEEWQAEQAAARSQKMCDAILGSVRG